MSPSVGDGVLAYFGWPKALNLTPERQKQRTLEVLVDQVAGLAAREPVLAIHGDVHWIDATTLEALGLLIERVRQLPPLVLITYRPEFTPPGSGHAHVLQLSLTRLTRSHGAALVERIIGGKALPPGERPDAARICWRASIGDCIPRRNRPSSGSAPRPS